MTKYRIVAVRPDCYRLEKKGWFFWWGYLFEFDGYDSFRRISFKTPDEARDGLIKHLTQKQKELDHISQPPVYLEM